jgi:hypothetical protein
MAFVRVPLRKQNLSKLDTDLIRLEHKISEKIFQLQL